jgi:hypothetical protein
MKRPRGTGSIFQFKGCDIWYLKYYRNGKPVRESSHSDKQKRAEKLLAKRLAEISTDTYIEPADRKVTVDSLYAAYWPTIRTMKWRHLKEQSSAGSAPRRMGSQFPPLAG